MHNKIGLKLEAGLMEQAFKIQESDYIKGLKGIENIVDGEFLQACIVTFSTMNKALGEPFKRNIKVY